MLAPSMLAPSMLAMVGAEGRGMGGRAAVALSVVDPVIRRDPQWARRQQGGGVPLLRAQADVLPRMTVAILLHAWHANVLPSYGR